MSLSMPWASKMDAAGNQADIAKTIETLWFLEVLEGCRVIQEAWRSSGERCWHTGWQKAGWLEGWLALAGRLAGRLAGHRDPMSRREA